MEKIGEEGEGEEEGEIISGRSRVSAVSCLSCLCRARLDINRIKEDRDVATVQVMVMARETVRLTSTL